MRPSETVQLTPGKRVLFLTKDPELIRKQLSGELDLQMEDLTVDDLLDDINTDAMTPAWVCFSYRPEDLARNAYAGLIVDGERLFERDALINGNFEVIVSGLRKGVGSSRETAVQAEKWSGIRIAIAASFAPIHAANNINQGVLMGDHALLERLQAGERIDLDEFYRRYDPITQLKVQSGGLFAFSKAAAAGDLDLPESEEHARPQTMAEKILSRHRLDSTNGSVQPGDALVVRVDGGYSHEFTTAQVHHFLSQEYGEDYEIQNPERFAVFEDHLIYAEEVPKLTPSSSTRSRSSVSFNAPFSATPEFATSRLVTESLQGSATKWPACNSSPRETSCRRPTVIPAWVGATTLSPGAWEPPSTPTWPIPGSPPSRCRSRFGSSSKVSSPRG